MPEQNELPKERGTSVVRQAVIILFAAVAMGIAYNHTSPLGVRWDAPQPATPAASSTQPATISNSVSLATTSNSIFDEAPAEVAAPILTDWNPLPVAPPEPPASVGTAGELQFPELKWPEVKALLAAGQIALIDARLAETYALSHIPGAVSLPAYSPVEQLQAFAAKHSTATRYVIYCNSATCDMSHELAAKLARQFGYTNLTLMPGGFAEYVIAESGSANPPAQ